MKNVLFSFLLLASAAAQAVPVATCSPKSTLQFKYIVVEYQRNRMSYMPSSKDQTYTITQFDRSNGEKLAAVSYPASEVRTSSTNNEGSDYTSTFQTSDGAVKLEIKGQASVVQINFKPGPTSQMNVISHGDWVCTASPMNAR